MTPTALLLRHWRRQRGVAAIELALLMPLLLIMLAWMILYGRYMWHYTVAHKAAQDAARYMSTVPVVEMKNKILAGHAAAIAQEIVREEVAELAPGTEIDAPEIGCDNNLCGFKAVVPDTVRVSLYFTMRDTVFGLFLGEEGITFDVTVKMPYVGR